MKTPEIADAKNPIFFLCVFSLILGVELGSLSKSLDSHGSVLLVEPMLSMGNLIWLYFAGFFVFFSIREHNKMLKVAYFFGGLSFLFTESVINVLDHKGLYGLKILLLFTVTCLLILYLKKITNRYKAFCSEKSEETI